MLSVSSKISRSPFLIPLTGLLLFGAWPMSPLAFLVFLAFIPLLLIEAGNIKTFRFFLVLFLNFLIWNAATTWWIWNASEGGALGAIIANSMLMTIPWLFFRLTRIRLGNTIGYASLALYWITFEYIHHNWGLSWPWLTLGNVFANYPSTIYWYRYSGTTGGTFWVLIVNLLLFKSFMVQQLNDTQNPASPSNPKNPLKSRFRQYAAIGMVIFLPIIFSLLSSFYMRMPTDHNIVVIQPNIDPYKEKFTTDVSVQIEKLIRLSESQIDTNTRMVVWPETAVPTQVWEDQLTVNAYYKPIFAFANRHPKILLVTGIDSYVNHGANDPGGFSIRHSKEGGFNYEAFNTGMALDSGSSPQLYHKSKLVPGVESLPSWMGFLGEMFEGFGGISGTLGVSKEPVVFSSPNNIYKPAPVICYESIYSEYVTEYIRKGANIITIITNDGWWKDTPGYKQHQSYARLRAIETGCWVVRSANTGISCFISPQGVVYDAQPWDTEAAIKMNIPPVETKTFYVKHGDWISRIAWVLAAIVLLWTIVASIKARYKK
ncbi:MAG: apolipoprotein N-acyltransferase [Bacteroidota bacterium]